MSKLHQLLYISSFIQIPKKHVPTLHKLTIVIHFTTGKLTSMCLCSKRRPWVTICGSFDGVSVSLIVSRDAYNQLQRTWQLQQMLLLLNSQCRSFCFDTIGGLDYLHKKQHRLCCFLLLLFAFTRPGLVLTLQTITLIWTLHNQSKSHIYSFFTGMKIEPTIQEADGLVVPFNFRGSRIEDVLCRIKGDTVTTWVEDITGANTYVLPPGDDYGRGSAHLEPADGGYVLLVLTGFQRPDISITWEKPFIS